MLHSNQSLRDNTISATELYDGINFRDDIR